ncbi:hypothetical protein K8I28_01690 [bacterium]|nr:hypothetical protein [bacterium]
MKRWKKAPSNFRCTRIINGAILLFALLILLPNLSFAGTKVSISDGGERWSSELKPYITLFSGAQQPEDPAFDQVFSNQLIRFGGGFGLQGRKMGMELIARSGSIQNTMNIQENPRSFYFSATELQIRMYGLIRTKHVRIPAGFSAGLLNVTVDRGYPGQFDRFGGDGFQFGPFARVEYDVSETLSLGLEVEYAVGEAEFPSSQIWNNQNRDQIVGTTFNPGQDNFWDTVGADFDQRFTYDGMIYTLRLTIFLPTFSYEEE